MIDALTHGWPGIALGYAAVQVPMIAGLMRARARLHHYLLSPVIAAPLTAVAAAGIALSSSLLAHLGFASHGFVQLAVAVGFSAALGYAGGNVSERDAEENTHRRGALVADRPPANATKSPQSSREVAIRLAGTAVPSQDEAKHFKLIGTTGTGKSTAIQEIISGALARGDRAVIADPDAGYLNRFYRPERGDVLLNPFDQRSVRWDLFSEIKCPYDVEQLARSLIPDHEGPDRSWRGYARTFLSSVTRQAHEAGVKDTDELYRLLVVADTRELRGLVRGTPAQPFLEEHNSRMFDSIRSVTSSAVSALQYVGQQKAPRFSVREWISEEAPGVLFIPYKAGQIAALRSTISAWMRLAIFEAMEPDERREKDSRGRLWFVVDELDALGQIDGLKDALARLRKFGGRCVLGFQSIAQVSSTYGQGDAHTIVENCGNTLILRCSASEGGGTARFASQLIGEREVVHTTVSTSRRWTEFFGSVSRSEHLSVEPAVLPSQIEQLPDLAGFLKYASDPRWQRVRLDATRAWQASQSDRRHKGGLRESQHSGRSNDGPTHE
ncbi:MAG TPA: type IV secretion system DNA-binding domain-containing protein [Steroidobacteraceae bacterium]|jgi:type IV secretory pathway TraG/TraD family ATPase VirD4|nr:type IV secretion system DNA-binding domain-containing protein [Steroidobacteraceae bacterium]